MMTCNSLTGKAGMPALLAGISLLALAPASHAAYTTSVFATGSPVNGTSPDSITVAGGSVFVEYGNGANSSDPLGLPDPITGVTYKSTIVQYSFTGQVQHSYSFNGSDDGLRYNPTDGTVWVLQNQDGNSGLTILNPTTGTSTAYTYDSASAFTGRGYDDAQFLGGKTFLSVSNPAAPTDAVIVTPTFNGSVISTSPVVTQGAAGINDPDSLDLTPSGALLLTGGDDGALVTVTNPGTSGQTVKTTQLVDASGNKLSALDDANIVPTGAQTLLVAGYNSGQNTNNIYAVTGSFTPGQLVASIGSTNSLDLVDLNTGISTPITAIPSPHGQAFLPNGISFAPAVPEPSSLALLGLPLVGLALAARRRRSA